MGTEQMIKSSKRIAWIDIAKGVAILSVLLGHTLCPEWLHVYIYSFHMPLFFLLSGYTLTFKEEEGFGAFLRRKGKALLIPYLSFAFFIVIFEYLVQVFKLGITVFHWKQVLGSVFLQWHLTEYHFELWFLISLFSAEVLLYVIHRVLPKRSRNGWLPACAGLIGGIGLVYQCFVKIPLIWNFDVTMVAIGFLGVGYALRLWQPKQVLRTWQSWLLLIGSGVLHVLVTFWNYQVSNVSVNLYGNAFGNVFLFLIAALSGCLFFILLSKRIQSCKLLEAIGRKSLLLYCMHTMVYTAMSVLVRLLFHFDFDTVLTLYGNGIGLLVCLLITVGEVLILMPVALMIERWFPFVLGRKKKEHVAVKK